MRTSRSESIGHALLASLGGQLGSREYAGDATAAQTIAVDGPFDDLGVLSPRDLERRFGMIDGDIFHGALSLNQLFSARPQLGFADYRMPVGGLYLCGSGAHAGGGVTGAPGHNAAREIIRDLKGWWRR